MHRGGKWLLTLPTPAQNWRGDVGDAEGKHSGEGKFVHFSKFYPLLLNFPLKVF